EREYEEQEEQRTSPDLVYKTTDLPRSEPDRPDDPFFAEVMMHVVNHLRDEFERDLRQIERDLRHVRAALATELSLRADEQKRTDELVRRIGGLLKSEGHEVIDLPLNFCRRRAA